MGLNNGQLCLILLRPYKKQSKMSLRIVCSYEKMYRTSLRIAYPRNKTEKHLTIGLWFLLIEDGRIGP